MKCRLLRIKDLSSIVLLLCDSFMLGSEISPGSIPIEHLDGNMLQVKARRHHNLIEMLQGIFKSWSLDVSSIWEEYPDGYPDEYPVNIQTDIHST